MRLSLVTFLLILSASALAQTDSVTAGQNTSSAHEQLNSSAPDPGMTIKVRSNLVEIRVVVRGADGKPVGNLTRDDFRVYDNGKQQSVTTFAVETPESRREKMPEAAKSEKSAGATSEPRMPVIPQRFVALVFDDVHLSLQDTARVKKAAELFLHGMTEQDRMGIYSTSGQVTQEFTADTNSLQRSVSTISPRPLAVTSDRDCPNVPYSMADRIENDHDPEAMDAVVLETLMCAYGGDPKKMRYAQSTAQAAIHQALRAGDGETEFAFRHLEDAVRRLQGMPGERILMLISPGFQFKRRIADETNLLERANRAGIVINTFDARGLYVPDGADPISKRSTDAMETGEIKSSDRLNAQREQFLVLADLANATGGTFFHNSNDLLAGLKMAAPPEICYVLGFSPSGLKPDGRYHVLDVKLSAKRKLSVQARRGYYAPRKMDTQEQEEQDIADHVYSREETGNLFFGISSVSSMRSKDQAQLTLMSHIAVKNIHFRRVDGKNSDVLKIVTAIFDENGNFVTIAEKVLTMNLNEAAYDKLSRTGLPVNFSFNLKPGRYLVRQVLRDSEDGQVASKNRAIDIAD